MRCVLTTKIPMYRVAVFAEMAWIERRPELGLICRAAWEHGGRITTAVVRSKLPTLADAGANNVIAWCKMLGLCDKNGALTKSGEDAANTDEAPVPEQGVYGLWIAQHPVLGRRVLAVERLASKRDQRFEAVETLPVEPDRGEVFRSVLNKGERFMVRDLPTSQGKPSGLVRSTQATCTLSWTLDFDQGRDSWQLSGMIEAPQRQGKDVMSPIQHEPESEELDLWKLAEKWGSGPLSSFGRWDAKLRRLAIAFDAKKPTQREIDTFRKTLDLDKVEIMGNGSYEKVTLKDVPIAPATAPDAQRWALARLDHATSEAPSYRSRADMRALFAELTEGTPLEEHEPTLPSHDHLLKLTSKNTERFWYLAAPVDLSPSQVNKEELGPLQIGARAAAVSISDGVVRIPYRGAWSMLEFVEQLLASERPRRILLCDRYVRGDGNLAALKLFVASIRAVAPNAEVEVWTGDEETNLKRIEAITRVKPRSYAEMFKGRPPHDRYLLVQLDGGEGFGWQMSNSPLHARCVEQAAPETPLRWRDLAATRVSADALDPSLRQWLVGGKR
jgi:hypothetical protein